MFYAILGIFVVVALFLIFRDDHDDSYNKGEKTQQTRSFSHIQGQSRPKKTGARADVDAPLPGNVDAPLPDNVEMPLPTDVDVPLPDFDEELDLSFLDGIDYSEDLEENTETFDIIGLRYHCTEHDCGTIVGVVRPEPTNEHDPRAQAVYRNDGKLLGYIPRTQLDWYEDFNERNVPCPFVGEIELDGNDSLIAEIKVIIPSSREFVEEEIEDGL